jgi:putative nucleotidyltransferase with HDIG domain
MVRIEIDALQPNMVLGQDVYNKLGVLFIASGTVINKTVIESLRDMNLGAVDILDKEFDGTNEVVLIDCKVQEKYEDTVKRFKMLFKGIRYGDKPAANEVQHLLAPLVEEIMTNDQITKKLWQIHNCDEYTYDHSVTVSMASALLGKWMHYDMKTVNALAMAGLMHDIGKCNIPDSILNKPDALTDEEYRVMKTHATLGYVLLMNGKGFSEDILKGVYEHHERYDGSGYPNGIKGNDIHEFARAIAIADVYSAATSERVYRKRMSPFLVAKLILENRFGYLDPELSSVFLNQIGNFYIGSIVKLSNGVVGHVVMTNRNEPYRPLIHADKVFYDLSKNHHLEIMEIID